jgi:hypothetical protein
VHGVFKYVLNGRYKMLSGADNVPNATQRLPVMDCYLAHYYFDASSAEDFG